MTPRTIRRRVLSRTIYHRLRRPPPGPRFGPARFHSSEFAEFITTRARHSKIQSSTRRAGRDPLFGTPITDGDAERHCHSGGKI